MLTEREYLAFLRAGIENQHSTPEIFVCPDLKSASHGSGNLPSWASDPKFAHLRRATLATHGDGEDPALAEQSLQSIAQLLESADSLDAAYAIISGRLKTKLCSLLMVEAEDLDPTKPIFTYGLDSLVSVELRNWIAKEAGARVQLMDITKSQSWGDLVSLIVSKSNMVDHKRYASVNGKS